MSTHRALTTASVRQDLVATWTTPGVNALPVLLPPVYIFIFQKPTYYIYIYIKCYFFSPIDRLAFHACSVQRCRQNCPLHIKTSRKQSYWVEHLTWLSDVAYPNSVRFCYMSISFVSSIVLKYSRNALYTSALVLRAARSQFPCTTTKILHFVPPLDESVPPFRSRFEPPTERQHARHCFVGRFSPDVITRHS